MNNKFSTVISYERPAPGTELAGNSAASRDIGALMRALGFMGLWLVLTVFLLAEPLMSNLKAAQAKQEAASLSIQLSTDAVPAAVTPPHQLGLRHAPTNLNARAAENHPRENKPAQLSYALLTL
jgi:hypothetical protein